MNHIRVIFIQQNMSDTARAVARELCVNVSTLRPSHSCIVHARLYKNHPNVSKGSEKSHKKERKSTTDLVNAQFEIQAVIGIMFLHLTQKPVKLINKCEFFSSSIFIHMVKANRIS